MDTLLKQEVDKPTTTTNVISGNYLYFEASLSSCTFWIGVIKIDQFQIYRVHTMFRHIVGWLFR